MATTVTLKPNAIDLSGSTSGTTTLQASAVAGTTTVTLPAATDTLVGKATTDTLTNKTLTAPVLASANITTALTLTSASGTSGQVLTSAGTGAAPTWTTISASAPQIQPITASVATNALTVTLNPTVLDFRSSTLSSGTVNTRTVSTAISITVSSGSTLGTVSASKSRVAVIAIDNSGTVELAVVNIAGSAVLDESTLISTTAEGGAGAADSVSTIYSTTARTSVPFRVVGFVESTQATAGTWATAPSTIQGAGGESVLKSNIVSGTAVASTSGTSIDFTGIPSWVKRITVMLSGVSTNGTSIVQIQIGTSGGVQTTGYSSGVWLANTSNGNSTSAFLTSNGGDAAYIRDGMAYLTLLNSATGLWTYNSVFSGSTSGISSIGGGSKTLSGTLDRVRITTVNGTDTFDAGSVNILYE